MASSDSSPREVLETAYARLREKLEAKDVSADNLKAAALEALEKAKQHVELDPAWVAGELNRLRDTDPNGEDGD